MAPSLLRSLGGLPPARATGENWGTRRKFVWCIWSLVYTETLCFCVFYIYTSIVVEKQFWLVYMETMCFCVFRIYTSAFLLFVFSLLHKQSHTNEWRCTNKLGYRLEELP